jgi:hypothetical protein
MLIEKYPYRSHCSDISDEQLILLDFLFNIRAPIDVLQEEVFSSHLNVPYSHGFSNLELAATLNKLVANGQLFIQQQANYSGKTSYYGLTEKGGDIWADERKPVWDLYIGGSVERQVSTDRSIACLRAYSLDVLNEYLNFCIESKFLGALQSEPKYDFDYP